MTVFGSMGRRVALIISSRDQLHGHHDIYSPYGFGGILTINSKINYQEMLSEFMKSRKILSAYLMPHPLYSDRNMNGNYDANYTQSRNLFVLKIGEQEEDILRGMKKKSRYALRQQVKNWGNNVVTNKSISFSDFYSLYTERMIQIQAKSSYLFCEETLSLIFESPNTVAIGVKRNEELTNVGLFLYSGKIGEYFLSANSSKYNNLSRLIIWEAIKILKIYGVESLHLGGGITSGDSLESFKESLGSTRYVQKCYQHVADHKIFHEKCKMFATANYSYFPPYEKFKRCRLEYPLYCKNIMRNALKLMVHHIREWIGLTRMI